jgi:hypothetical protein
LRTIAILAATEDDRDKPSGAGVAPERQEEEPRAGSRRGKGGSGKQAFFAYLSRKLFTASPRSHEHARRSPVSTISEDQVSDAFKAEGQKITGHNTPIGENGADNSEHVPISSDETELGGILAAISDDVERWAQGARNGINSKYAAQIAFARKHLPRKQVAGVVRALIDSRNAELAYVTRAATADRMRRFEIAISNSRSKSRSSSRTPYLRGRKPPERPRQT